MSKIKKSKYEWVKEGVSYAVYHDDKENKIKTMICITDTSEKAHFIATACNYLSENT